MYKHSCNLLIFIHDHSNIATLLIWLTWKNTTWNFDFFCYEAFNTLKKAFTFTLIFTHWISNIQMIVETDALEYTLVAILSIIIEKKEIHLVAFHFCSFKATEFNYDIYNKELFMVFEAFCT